MYFLSTGNLPVFGAATYSRCSCCHTLKCTDIFCCALIGNFMVYGLCIAGGDEKNSLLSNFYPGLIYKKQSKLLVESWSTIRRIFLHWSFNITISGECGSQILRLLHFRFHICILNVRIATETQYIMRYDQYWHGVHDCAAPQWSPVSCGEFGSLWHLTAIRLTWMCLLDALSPTFKRYMLLNCQWTLSSSSVICCNWFVRSISTKDKRCQWSIVTWDSAYFLSDLAFFFGQKSIG